MPTPHDVAEIGLKLIAVYFVMQGLAVIVPIAATLDTMPSIPHARWFVSLGAPGGANCQRSGDLCRVPPGRESDRRKARHTPRRQPPGPQNLSAGRWSRWGRM